MANLKSAQDNNDNVDVIKEGAKLSKINATRDNKATKAFAADIAIPNADKEIGGFFFRLGTYMLTIRETQGLEDGQRITTTMRKAWKIDTIPTNRCSEAMRYVTTIDAVAEYLKDTGKQFTSLTALFAAIDKDAKADAKADAEADGSEDDSDDSDGGEGGHLTLENLVAAFVSNCAENNFDLVEAMEMLVAQAKK